MARLKNASFSEILHRIGQKCLHYRLKYLRGTDHVFPPHLDPAEIRSLKLSSLYAHPDRGTLEDILHGGKRFTLKADMTEIDRYEKIFSSIFSPDIRDTRGMDIRQAWEPSRLQHISLLLASYAADRNASQDKAVLEYARQDLIRWIERNPFLKGIHYMSAMECGLRIPVFFQALKIIDSLDAREREKILTAAYQHAWWVYRNLSLYSSLGNHTICEAVGLIFGGALFRNTEEGDLWLQKGLQLLSSEIRHQIRPDGGPAEQSLSYHRFVLDLYWLAVDFLGKNSLADCQWMKTGLMQGEEFLAAFEDGEGCSPSIGDSDGGNAVAPGIAPERKRNPASPTKTRTFEDSGYTIIRTETGAVVSFDHGPLGMPPLYNHGHADALSITLSKGGRGLIVDPGTGRYNTDGEARRYFKGTRAHNTVTVDGLDQAVQETGFIWSHPYNARLIRSVGKGGAFVVEACHDGYARLEHPVIHQRRVTAFHDSSLLVRDIFLGSGIHEMELNFHLHPEVVIERRNRWWILNNGGVEVSLLILGDEDFLVLKGQRDPLMGWYSPAYGIMQESPVLNVRRRGEPSKITFTTIICTGERVDADELLEREKLIHE